MTKRKIARSKRTNKAPRNRIAEAAKRAGIKPAEPKAPAVLTAEDEAIIAKLESDGLGGGRLARGLVAVLRSEGRNNDLLASALRREASTLKDVAKHLRPTPQKAHDMLADALEVVEAAASVFYVNGLHGGKPLDIMAEAMHSVEQELDGLSQRLECCDSAPDWQELWRMRHRVELARKLADFRRTHGEYKPQTNDAEQTETAVTS